MELLVQVLASGILLGGLYALMALGLALVWGVLNIVNLSHGALIMLGAYATYFLFTGTGLDPFAALPITAIALFVLGYLIQRGILNLVIRGPMFNTLLITFGIEVILTYLAQLAFSADFRAINPSYAGNNFRIGGITIPLMQVLAFAVAMALTIAMWLFLLHTRVGRGIRAAAQNLVAARLYGVAPRSIMSGRQRASPNVRSRRPPQQPGRTQDQHENQDAEARDVAVRRSGIERGQRFDDAEDEAAHDDAERILEAADDRDRE